MTARIAGGDVAGRLGKPGDFAKSLVRDIVGGAAGTVGRGNMPGLVRLATAVFPRFLLVGRCVEFLEYPWMQTLGKRAETWSLHVGPPNHERDWA